MSNQRLPEVVGARVRVLREATGRSQDDLAHAAQRAGLDWTRASVASLETGRRGLSAEELLLLPLAFVFLDGEGHTLAELLEDAPETIVRPNGAQAGTGFLRRMLDGGNYAEAGVFERELAAGSGRPDDEQMISYMAAREAERHVADALGTDAETVAETAYRLWGRGLTEERERRLGERADEDASPRSLQAIRGHVTRELIEELREGE